jgi:enediyne biosynthesis protein E4
MKVSAKSSLRAIKILFISGLFIFSSCQKEEPASYSPPSDPLFVKLSPDQTGIAFKNAVAATDSFNVINYRNFYNGGGVAIGDINNDGLNDVFLTSNAGKNKLYLNKGNWKFDDISSQAGIEGTQAWSTGVTMADVNADGLLDIYVCNSGNVKGDKRQNELYVNQGNLKFKESAQQYGLNDGGLSTHAAFFDYDLDGDLDCFVLNNSFKQTVKFDFSKDYRSVRDPQNGHRLYQNTDGKFTDISAKAGIYGSEIGFGLGINVGDLNGDKYPDVYISNDLFERDYLYINNQKGAFSETLPSAMGHVSINSMGADMADINNDGLLDIFATDMLPESDQRLKMNVKFDEYDVSILKNKQAYHYQYLKNMLQLNNGDGTFSEIGSLAGVDATDWSWGALIFDFENDGWKDIFVSNGMFKDINDMDYIEFVSERANAAEIVKKKGRFDFNDFVELVPSNPLASYAFVNQQNLTFKNQAYELGLGKPGFNNGAAYGDLDNDGDLDLVLNNLMEEAGIFRNDADKKATNNYLKVKFEGQGNTFGVGSEVQLWGNNQTQIQNLMPARGFQSCMPHELVFGLGKNTNIDSLVVVWPNLQKQTLRNIKPNQTITLKQSQAIERFIPQRNTNNSLFADITATALRGNLLHRENYDFVDFNRERLLPKMLSTEGPRLAIADVNGDKLDDFWVAGPRGDAGKVFLQIPSGSFVQSNQPDLAEDSPFEDTDAAFFDYDRDGDQDLMVASGGYENSEAGIVRLYLNDGKGTFKSSPEHTPRLLVNASCVRSGDFDGDGDTDVFVGGRAVVGAYGASPQSYLLLNENGNWTDGTPIELRQIGMVTDAAWTDYDGDRRLDLVVCGEWMPVSFFKNDNNTLVYEANRSSQSGFWTRLKPADLDADGDMDFVVGNIGQNTKFRASTDQPMMAFLNDFDKNEVPECLLTLYKTDGKPYLYAMKPDITGQMPSLKKQILHYKDYAGKSIEEIFDKDQLKTSQVKKIEELSSGFLINEGSKMTFKALPIEAQFSPIYGIVYQDFDQDKIPDLLLGGNFYGLKPETGRWDASYGTLLKGKGKGAFDIVKNKQVGLNIKGQVRDIVSFGNKIIIAKNGENLQILQKK